MIRIKIQNLGRKRPNFHELREAESRLCKYSEAIRIHSRPWPQNSLIIRQIRVIRSSFDVALCQIPINRCYSMFLQISVRLGEMMAAKKSSAGGQGRRMHRLQYQVLERVYHGLFGNGVVAPKDEHQMLALFREGADSSVGELFPAMVGV